jgi:hypothetical protein
MNFDAIWKKIFKKGVDPWFCAKNIEQTPILIYNKERKIRRIYKYEQ